MVAAAFPPLRGALVLSAYGAGDIHSVQAEPQHQGFNLIDAYVAIYWGVVVIVFLLTVFLSVWCLGHKESADDDGDADADAEDSKPPTRDLPENIWSMNLLASMGQAEIKHKWGTRVVSYKMRPALVAVISVFMSAAQVFALFCVIHDLDPDSTPITSKAASPWVHDVWTINVMKWFMVAILSINAVGEAGQCRTVVTATIETNWHRLRVPRCATLSVVLLQYVVLLLMLFVGISAVLSLNDVPNMIFSSMAITFITQTDELLFEMLHQVLDLEINFMIVHGLHDGTGSKTSGSLVHFKDNRTSVPRGLQKMKSTKLTEEQLIANPIPVWVDVFCHFLVTLPMFWGLLLISRAFATNIMPNARMYHAIKAVEKWFE